MRFDYIYQKITKSKEFIDFLSNFPSAKLCAGFFILDFMAAEDKYSLDYMSIDRIFTFELTASEKVIFKEDKLAESLEGKKTQGLTPISHDVKIDLEDLKGISGVRALDEGIHSKFNKIIAVLQNYDGNLVYNLTCMLDGLIILHIIVDAITGDILKFERKSMMDLIRRK
jgi:hypothetical protein